MTEDQALELLAHHSFTHADIDHPKSARGFLGMLRPFKGELFEENFHELMEILRVLQGRFAQDQLDRQMIANFWGICYFAQISAFDEKGKPCASQLFTRAQAELLTEWIDCLSYAVCAFLGGSDEEEAFQFYRVYLEDQKRGKMRAY